MDHERRHLIRLLGAVIPTARVLASGPARTLATTLAATGASTLAISPTRVAAQAAINAGPYVPSPEGIVAEMLRMADIRPTDFVIDLGSGDGRIVLTAAQVYGASGFGVEIKPELVELSNRAARDAKIADRVRFIAQDLFKTDISEATVLTMYLLPETVNLLSDKLLTELRPGTRVLSHDYPLSGWRPEQIKTFDDPAKVAISGVSRTVIYLYRIPARVAGRWKAQLPEPFARTELSFDLTQQMQSVSGMAVISGREVAFDDLSLRGDILTLRLPLAEGIPAILTGVVRDDTVEGTLVSGGRILPWSARRVL